MLFIAACQEVDITSLDSSHYCDCNFDLSTNLRLFTYRLLKISVFRCFYSTVSPCAVNSGRLLM